MSVFSGKTTKYGQKPLREMDYLELSTLLSESSVPVYQSVPPTNINRKDIAKVPFAVDADTKYKEKFPGKEHLLFPDILREGDDWQWTTWTNITSVPQTGGRGGIYQCAKCPQVRRQNVMTVGKEGVYRNIKQFSELVGPQKSSFCVHCSNIKKFRNDADSRVERKLYRKQGKGIKPKRGKNPYFIGLDF